MSTFARRLKHASPATAVRCRRAHIRDRRNEPRDSIGYSRVRPVSAAADAGLDHGARFIRVLLRGLSRQDRQRRRADRAGPQDPPNGPDFAGPTNGGSFPKDRVLAVVTGTGRPVTAHGSSDMPPWGPIFRGLDPSEPRVRLRIENSVTYVETLQEPSTGPDDLGARLFKTHCATCHGPNGRGNGPLADQLRHITPDLPKFTARNGGVFPSERVQRIIDGRDVPSHGNREMPVG